MKLPYKLDSMELRNCNIGCRSACMYVFFFFALLAVFLTVLPSGIDLLGIRMKVDRNYRQERIPVGQPTGESLFLTKGSCRRSIPDGISGIPDGFWLSGVSCFLVVVAVWTPRSAPAAARRRPGCLLGMVTLAVCFLILVTEHGSEQVLCDIITLAWSQGVEIYP